MADPLPQPQPLPASNPWPSVVLQLGFALMNMVGTWAFVYFQARETRGEVEHVKIQQAETADVTKAAAQDSAAVRSIIVGDK